MIPIPEIDDLRDEFCDKDFRADYCESRLETILARQIRALRKQRGWTQTALADLAGKHQSQISDLENEEEFGGVTLETLQALARAFDVALNIRFTGFGDFIFETADSSMADLEVPSFRDDLLFSSVGEVAAPVFAVRTSNESDPTNVVIPFRMPFVARETVPVILRRGDLQPPSVIETVPLNEWDRVDVSGGIGPRPEGISIDEVSATG